jgi:hypothetical protein
VNWQSWMCVLYCVGCLIDLQGPETIGDFSLSRLFEQMKTHCPHVYKLLRHVLVTPRQLRTEKKKAEGAVEAHSSIQSRLEQGCVSWVALMKGRSERFNGLQKIIAIFLYCHNVPDDSLDLLSRLGVTVHSDTVRRTLLRQFFSFVVGVTWC